MNFSRNPEPETRNSELQKAPGPAGDSRLGSLPELRKDPLHLFVESRRRYGDIVRFRLGPELVSHLISHPDYIRHILVENKRNYTKGYAKRERDRIRMQRQSEGEGSSDEMTRRRGFLLSFKLLMGDGLLSSDGELWRRQRKLTQTAFHRKRLELLAARMTSSTLGLLDRWAENADSGRPLQISDEMMHLSLSILLQSLFSMDPLSEDALAVDKALTGYLGIMKELGEVQEDETETSSLVENQLLKAVQTLEEIVYRLIEDRRRSGKDRGDLLSMLLRARDEESGQGMTDRQLRDEILTMFLAGQETTSTGISWTWYVLSRYPDVRRRVHEEWARVLEGRAPAAEDLPRLEYTMMVISESMRVYTPVWFMMRNAIENDQIGGCEIAAGSDVFISPYVVHHHPDLWPRPEEFDPERFRPDRVARRPRFHYMPFGGGPRICIGANFALMQTQLVLATIGQRYRLEVVSDRPVEPRALFTLVPKNGLQMTLHRRNS